MLVVLASVTTAERMRKMLESKGVQSRVVQTPKSIAVGGCGYSLLMDKKDAKIAARAAGALGVKIKGFFEHDGTGSFVAVRGEGE